MLRAYALADLLEANLDSTAEGIFLSTTGGNLIGVSPRIPPPLTKQLCVLGALTWRLRAAAGPGRGASTPTHSNGGVKFASPPLTTNGANYVTAGVSFARDSNDEHSQQLPLPVLKAVFGSDARDGLLEMAVECAGRVCAYEYVREGLLVGAVSGHLIEKDPEESNEAEADETAELEDGENENYYGRTQQRSRLVRLLGIKASALADYLRDELREFKMPTGLE